METVIAVIAGVLVLATIWAGDWLRRAINEYYDDENHR
jgi:hypothetical protein